MDCGKVRDQFSALWEKELDPPEEKEIRDHLASCPECREDFVRFDKTLQRLHSVDEIEVPGDFLSGIYEKMKTRRMESLLGDRPRSRWLHALSPMKLPIQAVAMVAIVFLTLYLSRMTPIETPRLKGLGNGKPLSSEERKADRETGFPSSAGKKVYEGLPAKPVAPATQDGGRARSPSSGKKNSEAVVDPERLAQEKEGERPSKESKIVPMETPSTREDEAPSPPLLKEKREKALPMARTRTFLESNPPEKIVLTVTDREKAFSQIGELARQFGGEVVSAEESTLFVSLPSDSFREFEKGLAEIGLGSSTKTSGVPSQRPASPGLSAAPPTPHPGGTGRITLEILLILE